MIKCTKCNKNKTDIEFNFKIKAINLRHKQCKECTRLFVKNHYNRNKEYYLKKTHSRNALIKLEVFNYVKQYLLENPCVDCGESDIAVLEFDHNGKIPKFKAVSSIISNGYPIWKIKEEINKCDVRCANCHRRKTAKDFKWFKSKMPL